MKKMLLSAAIAAAMGTAGSAYAIDLSTALSPTNAIQTYAAEIAVGTDLALDDKKITGNVGFSITDSAAKYVRLDFTPGLELTFTSDDFLVVDNASSVTLASSGDNFAIFEVQAAPDTPVTQTDKFTIDLSDQTVERINAANYTVTYALYETAAAAIAAEGHLARAQGAWLTFAQGYAFSCETANSSLIDVSERTQFKNGWDQTNLGNLTLGVATAAPLAANGAPVEFDTYFAGATLTVAGSTQGLALTLDGEDADSAEADVTTFELDSALTDVFLSVKANGEEDMLESGYSVTVTQGNAAGLLPTAALTADCGVLSYSGSQDRLELALTPDGVFTQMLRVTNPSNTGGAVNVTVWNDAGEAVRFPLSAVEGVEGVLGAQSSTQLININDINAAAVAADAEFALADDDRNKLRVQVNGEFDGIDLQAVTVSRDNNAFFQTK